MSITLPPATFLFDFATYMGFSTIVVCSSGDQNTTDSMIEQYKIMMEQSNKYLVVAANAACSKVDMEFGQYILLITD